jgi:hypothetical protein
VSISCTNPPWTIVIHRGLHFLERILPINIRLENGKNTAQLADNSNILAFQHKHILKYQTERYEKPAIFPRSALTDQRFRIILM